MGNKYIPAFLILLFLYACNDAYFNETRCFNQYLNKRFQSKIPIDEHTFLLVATFRCSGCVQNSLLSISEKINENSVNSTTIITSDTVLIPNSIREKIVILLDENKEYENIGIPIANLALFKTKKGKIIEIRILNLDNSEQIINEEF